MPFEGKIQHSTFDLVIEHSIYLLEAQKRFHVSCHREAAFTATVMNFTSIFKVYTDLKIRVARQFQVRNETCKLIKHARKRTKAVVANDPVLQLKNRKVIWIPAELSG